MQHPPSGDLCAGGNIGSYAFLRLNGGLGRSTTAIIDTTNIVGSPPTSAIPGAAAQRKSSAIALEKIDEATPSGFTERDQCCQKAVSPAIAWTAPIGAGSWVKSGSN